MLYKAAQSEVFNKKVKDPNESNYDPEMPTNQNDFNSNLETVMFQSNVKESLANYYSKYIANPSSNGFNNPGISCNFAATYPGKTQSQMNDFKSYVRKVKYIAYINKVKKTINIKDSNNEDNRTEFLAKLGNGELTNLTNFKYIMDSSKLYIIGGSSNGIISKKCWNIRLDRELMLNPIPDMKNAREKHGVVLNPSQNQKTGDGWIIACGGQNTATVEKYDKQKGWTCLPSLSCLRANPSLLLFNRKYLYCFGGELGQSDQKDHYEYLDLEKLQGRFARWTIFFVIEQPQTLLCGVIKKGKDEYLLLGGLKLNDDAYDNYRVFRPEKDGILQFSKNYFQSETKEKYFINQEFVSLSGNVVNYSNNGDLLVYDGESLKLLE